MKKTITGWCNYYPNSGATWNLGHIGRSRQAAFDHLERLLSEAHRKLRNNRHEIYRLALESGQLKNDIAALHQLRAEFLK